MIISLSEFYYTNKFIPIATDSTLLKVVKVSRLVFLGLFVFFLDCALLAYRNITQKKDPDLSPLVEKTLDTGIQDAPTVEKISTETSEHSEGLVDQEDLQTDHLLSPPIKNTLASTETLAASPAMEQVSVEMPTDKYSISLIVQKKTLAKYLNKNFNKNFQVTPEYFLQELELFVEGKPISFNFIPVFAEGPFSIHKHLVKAMKELLKNHSNDELSKDYEEYTRALRGAINTEEYKNKKYLNLSLILQELCFAKFASTILTGLQEKTLENMLKFNSSRNMINISKLIKKDNEVLWEQTKTRKVRQSVLLNLEKIGNATGLKSDQLSSANIPELRSIHKVKQDSKEYNVYYLRYPTPTVQLAGSATTIAPEFIGLLDHIQKEESSLLHVNHQYMDEKSKDPRHVADNNRAKAIQKLEETHAEVFHFLSLPFDGPVIDKIAAKNKKELTKWKKSLVTDLIEEKNGFKLPKKFRGVASKKKTEIEQLLNNLHHLYFIGKSKLDATERRVLLVIFYSYLKEYFKSEYQIRIMASVCKDNKDRGNVSACIDEALFNLRLGRENDQQSLKDLHLRILSPFIFRNEGIVEKRLEFLMDLLNHISTLEDDQKEKIRAFKVNEQYQVIDQWIPRSMEEINV